MVPGCLNYANAPSRPSLARKTSRKTHCRVELFLNVRAEPSRWVNTCCAYLNCILHRTWNIMQLNIHRSVLNNGNSVEFCLVICWSTILGTIIFSQVELRNPFAHVSVRLYLISHPRVPYVFYVFYVSNIRNIPCIQHAASIQQRHPLSAACVFIRHAY